MQRTLFMITLAIFISACNLTSQKDGTEAGQAGMEKIVTATVEELLATPTDYDGKEVALSGMVTHVCRHGGQKCFVLGQDGETQIRIVTGGDIDEFETSLEGSTVAFKGVFRILNVTESAELVEDYESKAHHETVQPHTQAEQADYFVEAIDYKEVTP